MPKAETEALVDPNAAGALPARDVTLLGVCVGCPKADITGVGAKVDDWAEGGDAKLGVADVLLAKAANPLAGVDEALLGADVGRLVEVAGVV